MKSASGTKAADREVGDGGDREGGRGSGGGVLAGGISAIPANFPDKNQPSVISFL